MARHYYTDLEKQQFLGRLLVNGGDISLTSAQTGVSDRTLQRWKIKYLSPTTTTTTSVIEQGTPRPAIAPSLPPISADAVKALNELRHQMTEEASYLTIAIRPAIAEASLHERVMALTRLVDRIYKLSFQLPNSEEEDEEIEYIIEGAETFERDWRNYENGDSDEDDDDDPLVDRKTEGVSNDF